MTIRADLHIHSCLSPCGDLAMSPRTIADRALEAGLNLVALTDHNAARNVPAFAEACRERNLRALYGCEVTTSEEVHVLALYADVQTAVAFGDEIYASLPPLEMDPERYGDQVVVDTEETIVETLTSYLIGATSFSLSEVGRMIHDRGGLFIPAHIDRTAFSIWSQLGFLPTDDYDAVEMVGPPGISRAVHRGSPTQPGTSAAAARTPPIDPGRYPVVAFSDAHQPDLIGSSYTEFEADEPSLAAFRTALGECRVRPHVGR
ncbi:MAG: PHP domain-containing protein [Spirochaetota bacterium]